MGQALNFIPDFYESFDSEQQRWGKKLSNGSYTGLIGEIVSCILLTFKNLYFVYHIIFKISSSALIAIGDLHVFTAYGAVLDFSAPHSYDCLTFLTTEAAQDISWKTFIQPFSFNMWLGVLLSLFLVGSVFYILSFLHALLLTNRKGTLRIGPHYFFNIFRKQKSVGKINIKRYRNVKFLSYLNRMKVSPKNEDIFDSYPNCILLTYSMLMYVSLPKIPKNWPLRILTGWYWIYCILITVSYRASFTAILANPAPKITIDTLEELLNSRLTLTVGSEENKKLFDNAFDNILKELGTHTDIIDNIEAVVKQTVCKVCSR